MKMRFCPIVGGPCSKSEAELKVQDNTFFLVEAFTPERDRERREKGVEQAIKDALGEGFSLDSLRMADKEPSTSAIFCDVCRMIQSSAYGIADISGLNSNVLIEVGMMLSLSKPVFVLVKKAEEEDLKKKLPSDILWKRAVPYEEFIDVEKELSKQIKNRPEIKAEPSPVEQTKKVFAEIDPSFAQAMDAKIEGLKQSQQEGLARVESLLKEAKLDKPIMEREKIKSISPSLEKQIREILGKMEQIEKITGFPDNPNIALLRGNFHYERREYEKALELYDWAITLKHDFADAWFNKGFALGELGRGEEAFACFDKTTELEPNNAAAWSGKGFNLGKLGKPEEAIICYGKAIEIKSDSAAAWSGKGFNLGKLGKPEEAIICYGKAIEIKSDSAAAWSGKGFNLGKLGRWQEARQCFEKALGINKNDAVTINNLSEGLLILGDVKEASKRIAEGTSIAKEVEDKVICRFLGISALTFKEERKQASKEAKRLIDYLRELEEDFKVSEWDFSPLLPAIEEKLSLGDKRKLLSLISLLKGEIAIEDFERELKAP